MEPNPLHAACEQPAAAASPSAAGQEAVPATGSPAREAAAAAAAKQCAPAGDTAGGAAAAVCKPGQPTAAGAARGGVAAASSRRRGKRGQQGAKWQKQAARKQQQQQEKKDQQQAQQRMMHQDVGQEEEMGQQDALLEHQEGSVGDEHPYVEEVLGQQCVSQEQQQGTGIAFWQHEGRHPELEAADEEQQALLQEYDSPWEQQQEELLRWEHQQHQEQQQSRDYGQQCLPHKQPASEQQQQHVFLEPRGRLQVQQLHEDELSSPAEKAVLLQQQQRFLVDQHPESKTQRRQSLLQLEHHLAGEQQTQSVLLSRQSEEVAEVSRSAQKQELPQQQSATAAVMEKGAAAATATQTATAQQWGSSRGLTKGAKAASSPVAAVAAAADDSTCAKRQNAISAGAAAAATAAKKQQTTSPWKGMQTRGRRVPRWLPVGCLDREGEPPLHANIYLMMYFRVLNAVAYAARAAAIFDAYLYLRFGGNRAIGTLTLFSGLITIVVAPVAGVICDVFKSHRSNFLRGAAIFTLFCTYVNWRAVECDSFAMLILSTFMWKGWYEFVTVCSESLFNDCMPPGRRSELYVIRRIATTLANGVGPLLSLLVFSVEGNTWSLPVLHSVLYVGTILSLPQVLLLWWWEDVEPPPHHHAAPIKTKQLPRPLLCAEGTGARHQQQQQATQQQQQLEDESLQSERDLEQQLVPEDAEVDREAEKQRRGREVEGGQAAQGRQPAVPRAVPWLIFTSHCITFCGAGMTVKYFPLYFKTEYNFKPIHSCLLSSTYTLFIVAFTYAIQRVATRWGRAQASLVFTSLGVSCLFLLVHLRKLPLVLLVYLLRGAFQNASTPLDRSLVMDCIDLKNVGKWSALQSLATMMWSLSALVGGLIADKVSYRSTFVITGCVYVVSEIVYLPILWLLPPNFEKERRAQHQR